jgi:hypothetical protein
MLEELIKEHALLTAEKEQLEQELARREKQEEEKRGKQADESPF